MTVVKITPAIAATMIEADKTVLSEISNPHLYY
jgi:hypothetical protein